MRVVLPGRVYHGPVSTENRRCNIEVFRVVHRSCCCRCTSNEIIPGPNQPIIVLLAAPVWLISRPCSPINTVPPGGTVEIAPLAGNTEHRSLIRATTVHNLQYFNISGHLTPTCRIWVKYSGKVYTPYRMLQNLNQSG